MHVYICKPRQDFREPARARKRCVHAEVVSGTTMTRLQDPVDEDPPLPTRLRILLRKQDVLQRGTASADGGVRSTLLLIRRGVGVRVLVG